MFSVDSSGGKLSPLNIHDPLLRAEFFREIRLAQEDKKYRTGKWAYHQIQPSEVLIPELIAWRVYSVDTLKWVIMVAAALDDARERLKAGTIIYLPSTTWIRERIKYWQKFAQIER